MTRPSEVLASHEADRAAVEKFGSILEEYLPTAEDEEKEAKLIQPDFAPGYRGGYISARIWLPEGNEMPAVRLSFDYEADGHFETYKYDKTTKQYLKNETYWMLLMETIPDTYGFEEGIPVTTLDLGKVLGILQTLHKKPRENREATIGNEYPARTSKLRAFAGKILLRRNDRAS